MDWCINWTSKFLESRKISIPVTELKQFFPASSNTVVFEVANWVHFVPTYLENSSLFDWGVNQLNNALAHSTYLVGFQLTLADIALWFFIESNERFFELLNDVSDKAAQSEICHLRRYYLHLNTLGFFSTWKEALQIWRSKHSQVHLCNGHSRTTVGEPATKSTAAEMRFETGGKFGELPGAKRGEVVVRFPPEASGYLHIGHAKAALLNQHYRDLFGGKLILRFDDTNPSKEKDVFEEAILSDLPRLGIRWDVRSHTSDHFDLLMNLCEKIIRDGNAYVDNTDAATMKTERENRIASACRDNSVEKNLSWWEEMKRGTEFGLTCCVRAKIDMNSNNGALRDPTIYRCRREPHIRTGNKYNVYPIYDFACPVVDSVEGVTHALRTSEYNDRNDQYAWMCNALGLRCPTVIDFSRLALQHTVLSKRKLTWIVDEGLVDGWDDPRMPTVSGILRRGMTAEGLRQFILAQGSSRSSAQMEWDKIWAFNKKVIDPIAPRFTALLMDPKGPVLRDVPVGLVPVRIRGQEGIVNKEVPVHPKNPDLGTRIIPLAPLIYVEHADALCFKESENVTLINWGNCRVTKIERQGSHVIGVNAELNLADTDYKKTLKVTWLADPGSKGSSLTPVSCLIYDHLLTKPLIGQDDDFKLYVNRNSKTEQRLVGDSDLKALKKGDIIQIQRRGYYICDCPYSPNCPATGHESPCVLIQIPEGTAKSEPAVTGASSESVDAKKPASSVKAKVRPAVVSEVDEAKAAERLKKKAEKKEARKEGRAKWKQESQPQAASNGPCKVPEKAEPAPATPPTQQQPVQAKQTTQSEGKPSVKKQTKLGLEARKETDFADWYSELITKAELLEYYDVSGCYILRPWAYSIWQSIQRFMDAKLFELGVENAYFPMFVSKAALEREKNHIADFAPEVAWVTRSGQSDLAEPVAVRPTSETIMYPAFAKWIQSHRDLPLRINQWSNVVRWEFKHPQPFLRTREFLWQEGHTAYADKADAEAEVLTILDLYAQIYEYLLAVPVVKGRKTEREKFAGSDYTTTIEAYIAGTGRAIQGATSHHLGQNFSRMFDVTFDHPATGMPAHVYQNSWGLTTRTLGVLVMVHSDNKGLVLPPRVAPIQIVIVPCGITNRSTDAERATLIDTCKQIATTLRSAGYRVKCDDQTHVSPGWKFNHWEMKGVPVRLEIGPQEVANRSACLNLRHNAHKLNLPTADLLSRLPSILDSIHEEMLNRARGELSAHVFPANSMSELRAALDAKSLALVPFCGQSECEEVVRTESAKNIVVEPGAPSMGAKSLCIPFACEFNPQLRCGPTAPGVKCFNRPHCSRDAVAYTLFGRSY